MYWLLVAGLALLVLDAANQLFRMFTLRMKLGPDIASIQPMSAFISHFANLFLSIAALCFVPKAARQIISNDRRT